MWNALLLEKYVHWAQHTHSNFDIYASLIHNISTSCGFVGPQCHTQRREPPLCTAEVADRQDKAMANTKWSAWWYKSNKWSFLFIFNCKWTKNKKKKKKKRKHVDFIYLHKKQNVFKREEKKRSHCESKTFKDSPAHRCTCATSVCYVPLPFDRAPWSPPLFPSPPIAQSSETGFTKGYV